MLYFSVFVWMSVPLLHESPAKYSHPSVTPECWMMLVYNLAEDAVAEALTGELWTRQTQVKPTFAVRRPLADLNQMKMHLNL